MISTKFIAIPKVYDYPEDLEDGIFEDRYTLEFIYHPDRQCYDVCYAGEFNYEFSLDKYWIFIEGELRNGKTESYAGNGD